MPLRDRIRTACERAFASRWFLTVVLGLGTLVLLPALVRLYPPSDESRATTRLPTAQSYPASSDAGFEWEAIETDAPWVAALSNTDDSASETGLAEFDESSLDCMVEAWEQVEIGSPVRGKIAAIHAERADFVEKGQVLLELESDLERAEVRSARKRATMQSSIRSKEAREQLGLRRGKRAERLYASNAVSADVHDEILTETSIAKLELEEALDQQALAQIELSRALAALERRRVYSPIQGVVANRLMSEGEVVDEQVVLELAQLDPLRVEVLLPATRFGSVTSGMKAAIVPEVPGDEIHVATVSIVDRVVDAASGSFRVQLELPNPELHIPGGLRCRVRFLDASP